MAHTWKVEALLGQNLLPAEVAECRTVGYSYVPPALQWTETNPTYSNLNFGYSTMPTSPDISDWAYAAGVSTARAVRVDAASTSTETLGVLTPPVPVASGGTYSARAWCENASTYTSRTATVSLRWEDGAGATLATSAGTPVTLTTTPQAVTASAAAPTGTTAVRLLVEFDGSHTSGQTYYATHVEVVAGTALTEWVDITDYVEWSQTFTIARGRSDAQAEMQPGRLSGLRLDNTDGRFTIGNPAGAYGTRWRLGVAIRVSVAPSTTYYTQFVGLMDSCATSWLSNSNRRIATVAATDLLGAWKRAQWAHPTPWVAWWTDHYREWQADDTTRILAHWPCDQVVNDAVWTTQGTHPLVREATAPSDATGSGHPADDRPTLAFPANAGRFTGAPPAMTLPYWWVSFWIKMTTTPSTAYGDESFLPVVITGSAGDAVALHPTSDGRMSFAYITTGGTATDYGYAYPAPTRPGGLTDGQWHHIAVAGSISGTNDYLQIQMDGYSLYATSSATINWDLSGNVVGITLGPTGTASDTCEIAHVTFGESSYQYPVSAIDGTWVRGLRGIPANNNDQVSLQWVARYAGLPEPAMVSAVPGDYSLWSAATLPLTNTPSVVADKIAASNYGTLYATRTGGMRYAMKADLYSPTVRAVLTAADVDDLSLLVDRSSTATRVTLTNTAGVDPTAATGTTRWPGPDVAVTVTVEDEASLAAGIVETRTVSTAVEPDDYPRTGVLRNIAERLLIPTPVARMPEVGVDVLTQPQATQVALAQLDLFELLDVTDPDGDQRLLRVEGIALTVGASVWALRATTSAAGLILNSSTYGMLDGPFPLAQ